MKIGEKRRKNKRTVGNLFALCLPQNLGKVPGGTKRYEIPFALCTVAAEILGAIFLPKRSFIIKVTYLLSSPKVRLLDTGRRRLVLCHRGASQMNSIVPVWYNMGVSAVCWQMEHGMHVSLEWKKPVAILFSDVIIHCAGTNQMSSVISQPALVFKAEW